MTKRPPAPIRYLVLLTALLLLGAVVCARSRPPEKPAQAQQNPPAEAGADAGADAPAQKQTPPQKKQPDKEMFPATKSAGDLF